MSKSYELKVMSFLAGFATVLRSSPPLEGVGVLADSTLGHFEQRRENL